MSRTLLDTQNMAMFCDFENVALGVKESNYDDFDIGLVLEKLLLKGSIVVKKAYCDWQRYRDFKGKMHQASFELIEVPHVRISGKNSADIRMVVDALDLCYTKAHVDCFVIVSGDSDFSPLVSKLRENNKTVIGVGVKNSTSDLLIANCDEFIFYDDLVRAPKRRSAVKGKDAARKDGLKKDAPKSAASKSRRSRGGKAKGTASLEDADIDLRQSPDPDEGGAIPDAPGDPFELRDGLSPGDADSDAGASESVVSEPEPPSAERTQRGLDLIVETLEAILAERGEDERIWGSMIKQTLKRRNPGFNELYYGYRSFNRMLEEARDRQMIALEDDGKSGGYVVRAVQ